MYDFQPRKPRIYEDDPAFNPRTMGNHHGNLDYRRSPRRRYTADQRGTLAGLLMQGVKNRGRF